MRRPDFGVLLAEFLAAFAQQMLQRLHRGGDAERHRRRHRPVALLALRLENVGKLVAVFGRLASQRPGRIAVAITERVGQLRIDPGRAFGDVTALRPLA